MAQAIDSVSPSDVLKGQQLQQQMLNSMADIAQSTKLAPQVKNALLQQMQQILQQFGNMLNPSADPTADTSGAPRPPASQPAQQMANSLPPPPQPPSASSDSGSNAAMAPKQPPSDSSTGDGSGAKAQGGAKAVGGGDLLQPSVPDGVPAAPHSTVEVKPDGTFSTAPQKGALSAQDAKQQAVNVGERLKKDFGFNDAQTAGILGNLYHESEGMNSNVNEYGSGPVDKTFGPPNDTQFGYGMAQWTGPRKADLENFAKANGMDPSAPETNYQFLKHELEGQYAGVVDHIKATNDRDQAEMIFRSEYEGATDPRDDERKAAAAAAAKWLAEAGG